MEEVKDINKMTPEEVDKLKYEEQQKKVQTIAKVIRGVNDVWEKSYDFKELDLSFNIKLRLPNAIEQGAIFALRSSYLKGMDMYQHEDIVKAYQMLATIQTVGIDIPKEFKNPEEVYNIQPLVTVYHDWAEFMNTFRY